MAEGPKSAEPISTQVDPGLLTLRNAPTVGTLSRPQHDGAPPRFEYAEHSWLGDGIKLTWTDGKQYTANKQPFTLPSGVKLTYGQINALAGDFYATSNPISDGTTLDDQVKRFHDAWDTLAKPSSLLPAETDAILKILQTEVDAVAKAIKNHEDPSIAYSKLDPDDTINGKLQDATSGRPVMERYYELAFVNWDHFGIDAHTAYIAGHTAALQTAKNGDLVTAYAMNAFADHFLEDSFAAGHIRTPRRDLHTSFINAYWDLDSKYMHDEDNAIGLKVRNKNHDEWTAFGDKRLLDAEDTTNKTICQKAIQSSADEVYAVWKGGAIPDSANFAFQKLVPILDDDVIYKQELVPLFVNKDGAVQVRSNIEDRRTAAWTDDYTAVGVYYECKDSGWFKYKITMDGPPKQ